MPDTARDWPATDGELVELQRRLPGRARAALSSDPWVPPGTGTFLAGGCFIAFARGEAGPGHPGDRAWAAAVAWWTGEEDSGPRRSDRHLRGHPAGDGSRRADDVAAQAVVAGRVPASYVPGLLALREGPLLGEVIGALARRPDVLLVDATGWDHPRRAGLAVHLGMLCGLPTVGVTHRPLVATGEEPPLTRGSRAPLRLDGELVGYRVRTRTGARAVVAHAGWRTDPEAAAAVVLGASTPAARTPVPLQEARRVAREARARAGAG